MKFKLDASFGQTASDVFVRRGRDFHTVRDEKLSGADDSEILAAAVSEDRVLVTLDRDFTNSLRYPPETTSSVAVILPGRRASRSLLAALLESFLNACEQNLIHGKLWIVEPGRIREHRLEADESA